MYQLTRLEHDEKEWFYGGFCETVLIELYIDYRTNKKYILNKIKYCEHAYVKEFLNYSLSAGDIEIMPYDEEDELIYGENPLAVNSWRIECGRYAEDFLTKNDIIGH